MKKIPLTKGKFTLVDDEDYDFLIQWKWRFNGGYSVRSKQISFIKGKQKQKKIFMHRVINKTPEGMETDHIDGDKLNNQKDNLRSANRGQNEFNKKKRCSASSRFKGVCWDNDQKKWRARICFNKQIISLGRFIDEKEAAKAYNNAAVKSFGDFARLNRVNDGERT